MTQASDGMKGLGIQDISEQDEMDMLAEGWTMDKDGYHPPADPTTLDIAEQEALAGVGSTPEEPAVGTIEEPPAPGEALEIQYVRLDRLLKMAWEDNPKEHNKPLVANSITDYGFIDAIGVDLALEKIAYGHGRLEDLEGRKSRGEDLPRYIRQAADGMWLVPVTPLKFDDLTQLYRAALMHNRAGVARFDGRDYNKEKLNRALKAANAPQFSLPGFGAEEVTDAAWEASIGQFALPELQKFDAFDPSKLPDAPPPAEVVKTAFVVMVSVPDETLFREVLWLLSLGTRKATGANHKLANLDANDHLSGWRELLKVTAPVPAPEAEAPADPGEKPARKTAAKPARRSRFIGGLCAKCGGSRFERWGRDESGTTVGIVECAACGGAGTEEEWLKRGNAEDTAPLLAEPADPSPKPIADLEVEW